MELYREFFAIIGALNKRGIEYSVVGGIALAFHDRPRFTKDIDILARPRDLPMYEEIFKELGYAKTATPWTFKNTNITLHRFGKKSQETDEELLMIDLLVGNESEHELIIERSIQDESSVGVVRIASKQDLIWLKKLRGSKQDEADIENLEKEHEQD